MINDRNSAAASAVAVAEGKGSDREDKDLKWDTNPEAERPEWAVATRASEIRYRRLFEAARDGILMLDPKTRKITDANPFMSELLGYSHEELLGKELWEIGLLKDEEESRAAFRELQENHFIRYEGLPLQSKSGVRRDVEFVSNIYNEDGRDVIQCNIRDITERKQVQDEVRELSGHLLRSRDEERRRIGRELHDSTTQELAAVSVNLDLVQQRNAGRDVTTDNLLADSQAIIEQSQRELRTLAYQLHPPLLDELGLAGAVQEYAAGFAERSGIKVTLEASPAVGRLPADMERALFRVTQESLGNVYRHSGSRTATIRITREAAEIILEVSDQGCGLQVRGDGTVAKAGVGLAGMRERVHLLGGRFEIESGGRGTTVRAIVSAEAGTDEDPTNSDC